MTDIEAPEFSMDGWVAWMSSFGHPPLPSRLCPECDAYVERQLAAVLKNAEELWVKAKARGGQGMADASLVARTMQYSFSYLTGREGDAP